MIRRDTLSVLALDQVRGRRGTQTRDLQREDVSWCAHLVVFELAHKTNAQTHETKGHELNARQKAEISKPAHMAPVLALKAPHASCSLSPSPGQGRSLRWKQGCWAGKGGGRGAWIRECQAQDYSRGWA